MSAAPDAAIPPTTGVSAPARIGQRQQRRPRRQRRGPGGQRDADKGRDERSSQGDEPAHELEPADGHLDVFV